MASVTRHIESDLIRNYKETHMRNLLPLAALLATVVLSDSSLAEIKTETVIYQDGDVKLEGFVAYDSKFENGEAPGVLVVHQWMGLTDYEKRRCKELAELGYVAFALDIYGQGVRPDNPGDAGKEATIYKKDRELYRKRLNLGTCTIKGTCQRCQRRLWSDWILFRWYWRAGVGSQRSGY